MNVLMLFDIANGSFNFAKALRQRGIETHLIAAKNGFCMSNPLWDIVRREVDDPYEFVWQDSDFELLPKWVHIWDNTIVSLAINNLFKMIGGFDLIIGQHSAAIYLPFQDTPYMIYETGWLRSFSYQNYNTSNFARWGYAKASHILMTNPDMYDILDRIPWINSYSFMPFAIDTVQFGPRKTKRLYPDFTIFSPTRIVWGVKGNPLLLQAFYRLIKEGYSAKLVLVEWGEKEDIVKTKQLIKELEIEEHVKWLKTMTKPSLAETFNAVDVVADQFVLGSGAGVMMEAMACGKAVICYLDERRYMGCYGEMPPVLNAHTSEQILQYLIRCATNTSFVLDIGDKGRKFIQRYSSYESVAKRFEEITFNSSKPRYRFPNIPPLPADSKYMMEVKLKRSLNRLPLVFAFLYLKGSSLLANSRFEFLLRSALFLVKRLRSVRNMFKKR